MEVVELFKDALTYPTKDFKKLLILGVIFLIAGIFEVLGSLGFEITKTLGAAVAMLIGSIISLILGLLIAGYGLSITRDTIGLRDEIPDFDWVKNLIDGIKLFVLEIVYYIIPVVLTLVVAYLTGAFTHIMKIANFAVSSGSTNLATVPQSLIVEAASSFLIVFLIAAILFIIFTILYLVATAKLAETESLAEAINMIEVFNKIGEIGWVNFIIWIVVFILIAFVIGFVAGIVVGFLAIIPLIGLFIGILIMFLVVNPFIRMFSSRALGLIYNEAK